MVNVIGVRFENAGKLYFFDPGTLWPTPGDFVIVETSRGIEFGEVVTQIKEIDDATLQSPLRKVVRIATEEDVKHNRENKQAEKEAFQICQHKIAEHKLDMKLVSVEFTFDNSKILFYFTANGRVDFRSLVKDLAGVFKTRIELRQIGVRDEAKMLGGLGPCGRQICCGAFLGDFQPVSIKMAKEQNLSLNPNKISGICGRLMCCLKYEQDQYEAIRKQMPKVGKEVVTPDGNGVVWDLNVIKETVRVRIQKGDSSDLVDYPMQDVHPAGAAQRKPAQEAPARRETPAQEVHEEAHAKPARAAAEAAPREEGDKPARERREKPRREDRREKPRREEAPVREAAPVKEAAPAKEAAPVKAAPAAKPEPAKAEAAPAKPAANAASSWRAALEKAMSGEAVKPEEAPKAAPVKVEPKKETAPAAAPAVVEPKPAPTKPEPRKEAAPSPWKAALARAMQQADAPKDGQE